MPRLILMRHSKAEQEAATDHARPLSRRGRRDATAAGRLLADRGDLPALGLVSTAQRTRDTWEAVCVGLESEPDVRFDRALYDRGPEAVLELLAVVEPDRTVVLVIGHNPTIQVVAHTLADSSEAGADPAAEAALAEGLPTSALVTFDVPGDWSQVTAGSVRLTQVD
ncbi:MAG: histidine phosphatase family protein, partial [Propionibacteriales bacterium]|nr:histidine phosphatase family protein [Propionibacteriales bacterium]